MITSIYFWSSHGANSVVTYIKQYELDQTEELLEASICYCLVADWDGEMDIEEC